MHIHTDTDTDKKGNKNRMIPASSAAVERMFSICGHIFSIKRRRMSIKLFVTLVMLKLNEELLQII